MKKLFSIMIFILIFMGGCSPILQETQPGAMFGFQPDIATDVYEENCIIPKHSFAYQTSGKWIPANEVMKVLPSEPWIEKAVMPSYPDDSIQGTRKDWLLAVLPSQDGSKNIWVLRSWTTDDRIKSRYDSYEVLIYNMASKKWTSVPATVKGTHAVIGELFLTQDGTIWAHNYWGDYFSVFEPPYWVGISQENNLIQEGPILSKFSEEEKQFIPVNDTQNTPNSQLNGEGSKMLLDQNDVFWILAQGDGIYSYDPEKAIFKRQAALKDDFASMNIRAFALGVNNNIFLTDGATTILHYSQDMNNIARIGGSPLPLEGKYDLNFNGILADHEKRLWIGNIGWAEPDDYRTWYQLFPSPIFVSLSEGNTIFSQQSPWLLRESIDGRLWFKSTNGMAWLDPQLEKWCWFTTESSNLVEDSEHNLWMIGNHNLYELAQ